jgi:hypothetical protein
MVSSRGDFVVKPPRERVAARESPGVGKRFAAGNGSPMKAWLAVDARAKTGLSSHAKC